LVERWKNGDRRGIFDVSLIEEEQGDRREITKSNFHGILVKRIKRI
jgi:uncharacterized protein YqkB